MEIADQTLKTYDMKSKVPKQLHRFNTPIEIADLKRPWKLNDLDDTQADRHSTKDSNQD